MTLKNIRTKNKLTQQQAASIVGISLRSYKSYENESSKIGTIKYNYIVDKLKSLNPINEDTGILEIDDIKNIVSKVLSKYDVEFCYLFGSYAKSTAKEDSDVDLLISANVKGLQFFGMVEELRENLQKRIDVLDIAQLNNNIELTSEILKDGIKIYG